MSVRASDVIVILVTIIFPPAGAFFVTGCGCDLLINILLTLLAFFPGLLHAFWLIYQKMRADEQYGEGGYRYIGSGAYEPAEGQTLPPPVTNYGATGR
ncbi:UPF0057-domain-containing protein, partial [Thelephora ganbajun]